jgi:hypothetical protein
MSTDDTILDGDDADALAVSRGVTTDDTPYDPLAKALAEALPTYGELMGMSSIVPELRDHLAAALRNHPDRLRIAASLLTVEDVAEALGLCGIAIENVASIGNADQWLPDYELARGFLAALSGEHSDDH